MSLPPKNELDAACRQHDIEYERILKRGQTARAGDNWADKKFAKELNKWWHIDPPAAEIMKQIFATKKTFSPITGRGPREDRDPPRHTRKVSPGRPNHLLNGSTGTKSVQRVENPDNKYQLRLAPPTKGNLVGTRRTMPLRHRRSVPKTRSKPARRNSRKSNRQGKKKVVRRGNGSRRIHKDIIRTIAAVMNPPAHWERLTVLKYYNQESNATGDQVARSTWFDPSYHVTTAPTYTCLNPFMYTGMYAIAQLADASPGVAGKEFWIHDRKAVFRCGNHSNTTMHLAFYVLRCKKTVAWENVIAFLDQVPELQVGATALYTADVGTQIFNQVAGTNQAYSNKQFKPSEVRSFNDCWNIIKIQKKRLEPAETVSFIHSEKKFRIFSWASYNTISGFYMRGDVAFLIRWDSELIGSATTDGTTSMAAYADQGLTHQGTFSAKVTRRTTQQKIENTDGPATAGFLATDGETINVTMTDMKEDDE